MKTSINKIWIALLSLTFLFACEEEILNSVVSFSAETVEITTDDLSPVPITLNINPAAPFNSSISIIFRNVTNGEYGVTFTTDPAPSGSRIELPVTAGDTSAEFTIIPIEDGISFNDVEIAFEIVTFGIASIGEGLATELTEGRNFDFIIVNNKEQVSE